MESKIVLYEDWQMQCCGIPFSVGDDVKWLVCKCEGKPLSAIDLGHIDYYYEAHSDDYERLFVLSGKVSQIKALHENHAPSKDNPRLFIPAEGMLVNVTHANGWDEPVNGMKFSAYVVQVDNCEVRPANENEVPFC